MTLKITSFFILISISFFGLSQTFNKSKLDKYFETLDSNNMFMGSVALSKNGQLIYSKQIGYSDIETNIKPNENTKYRIGSISKTFTTVLIFKAIEEKKIALKDKIDKYFPSIKNAKKITISNLLNHRSGIHNFTAVEDYLNWNTESKTEKELLEIIEKGGNDFEPNTKAEYSNSNFVLLSFILQRIYNKSYAQILTEKIINPLELKNTYFGKQTNLNDNECYSYSFKGNWTKESETDMSIPLGAGAIVSNPSDLIQFSNALFNGKLISNTSIEKMKTLVDNFGMGLFQIPFYDKMGFGHNGAIDGFSSTMYHFDDQNISLALISNGTNFDGNQIAIALLSALYDKPYEIPSFNIIEVSPEILDKYLGIYASKEFPLKITISKNNNTLLAQGTGQPSFALVAIDQNTFKFETAGLILKFNLERRTMELMQGGETVNFMKE